MFLRVDVSEVVRRKRGLFAAVQDVCFNKYRKFKVKRVKLCVELMAFYRGLFWQWKDGPKAIFDVKDLEKERQVIQLTKELLNERLKAYKMPLSEG